MNKGIIKQRLLEVGYTDTPALDDTISKLCDLKGEPFNLLVSWLYEGKAPTFDAIEGVDSDFLKDKLCMKDPAIIIAFSMLIDEPKENSEYFKHLSENRVGFYPNGK